MSRNIEDLITDVAASIGLEVQSLAVHPSGALMVFTSEGKKYLELASLVGLSDSEVNAAILDILAPSPKDVVTEQERPVPAKKTGPKMKLPKSDAE